MFKITIKAQEGWDPVKEQFINTPAQTICLEHSLVSISKWESRYKKPFLSSTEKTKDETLYYIECMTITQNVNPVIYKLLDESTLNKINDYISDTMTATWFNDRKPSSEGAAPKRTNSEQITSELIYYWMVSYNIPFECQRWHLNRLLTLIRICNVKENQRNGGKGNKMSKRDILAQNKALNAARRKQLNSAG